MNILSRPTSAVFWPTCPTLIRLPQSAKPGYLNRELHSRSLRIASSRPQHLKCIGAAAPTLENSAPQVIVQGRNLKLTEALKGYADQKISKALTKFGRAIKEVDVNLSVAGGNRGRGDEKQKCEITIYTLRNGVVRAEDIEENLYAAIDKVCDMVTRKMRKVKEKAIVRGKWEGSAGPRGESIYDELPAEDGAISDGDFSSSDDEYADLDLPPLPPYPEDVLRTKSLTLTRMTAAEALEQVEQVGHSFFIYRDYDDQLKVLYKRKESGYGIIVPQLAD